MSDFSAQEAGLGYFYQARYGLWLLLDGDEEQELVLESLDDIVIETSGVGRDLIQTKHHVRSKAALTNISPQLWKTLRVWSTHAQAGQIAFPATRLMLITTATAPDGSIAARLRPDGERDCGAAQDLLCTIAISSKNAELKPSFEAFMLLTPEQQMDMLNATYVIDGSPTILDTAERIRKKIRSSTNREHREGVFERLQGWWFEKVVEQLTTTAPIPISGFEVYDKLASIAEQFRPDALPIDFLEALPETVDAERDNRLFVQQLRLIDIKPNRIEKAIIDYYRAFEQRSRWAREDLLIGGEVNSYEKRLIDEWERFSAAITQELPENAADDHLKKVGREILTWMELRMDIRIRQSVTEPFVMRGSYHMLANKPAPAVWWHPLFMKRVAAVVVSGNEK